MSRRLRAALHAYPRAVRQADGDVLLSLARDLADDGSVNREALGLVRGGLIARAGSLAQAPWEAALRRVALPIAGALLAIVCGAAAFWLREPAWPGWSWLAVLTAPALAVAGLLSGRRALLALGAVLIGLLGVAQGNSRLRTVRLEATIDWPTGGFLLPLLGCAIPAALLFLAAAASPSRPASPARVVRTLGWVVAGAIAVRVVLEREFWVGAVRLDAVSVCMAACAGAALLAFVVGVARRRRDPAGLLAGTLALATVVPVVSLYGYSRLPLGDGPTLLLLAATAVVLTAGFAHVGSAAAQR